MQDVFLLLATDMDWSGNLKVSVLRLEVRRETPRQVVRYY
jgi:hypothetical protein